MCMVWRKSGTEDDYLLFAQFLFNGDYSLFFFFSTLECWCDIHIIYKYWYWRVNVNIAAFLLRSPLVENQATVYASHHIWCLTQARINLEGCARKGIWRKNGGDGKRWWAPISHDGVAVHLDCWHVYLCYLHFSSENPEDGKQRYDTWV